MTQQNVKHPFMAAFWDWKSCHFVRHSPSFMGAILSSISFWIWRRHQLSSQRVLCRPRFFCKLYVWLRLQLSHIYILYIFFRVQLSCVLFLITQTQDIMTGVLVGNDAREAKIQNFKRWQRKGILTKAA